MILHIFALSVKWMMFKNSCKNIEKCRDIESKKQFSFPFFFFLQQSAATVVYSFYAIVVTNVT